MLYAMSIYLFSINRWVLHLLVLGWIVPGIIACQAESFTANSTEVVNDSTINGESNKDKNRTVIKIWTQKHAQAIQSGVYEQGGNRERRVIPNPLIKVAL